MIRKKLEQAIGTNGVAAFSPPFPIFDSVQINSVKNCLH